MLLILTKNPGARLTLSRAARAHSIFGFDSIRHGNMKLKIEFFFKIAFKNKFLNLIRKTNKLFLFQQRNANELCLLNRAARAAQICNYK